MVKPRYVMTSFPNELWDGDFEKVKNHVKNWVGKVKGPENLIICCNIESTSIGYKR